ncbi:MAG: hypothetical protein IIU18_01850, partial [Oscillospiraceae bacterium]|nr:hypothetical protein [Oscillospiraceae bacterium]
DFLEGGKDLISGINHTVKNRQIRRFKADARIGIAYKVCHLVFHVQLLDQRSAEGEALLARALPLADEIHARVLRLVED